MAEADLRMRIEVQLRMLPKSARNACGVSGDAAVKHATDLIMERVLAGFLVIAPEQVDAVPYGQAPGRFGVTEPWPAGCAPEDAAWGELRPIRR